MDVPVFQGTKLTVPDLPCITCAHVMDFQPMKCEKWCMPVPGFMYKNLPLAIHHILATFTSLIQGRMVTLNLRSLALWTPTWKRATSFFMNTYFKLHIREKLPPFKISHLDKGIYAPRQLMVSSLLYKLRHNVFIHWQMLVWLSSICSGHMAFFKKSW